MKTILGLMVLVFAARAHAGSCSSRGLVPGAQCSLASGAASANAVVTLDASNQSQILFAFINTAGEQVDRGECSGQIASTLISVQCSGGRVSIDISGGSNQPDPRNYSGTITYAGHEIGLTCQPQCVKALR